MSIRAIRGLNPLSFKVEMKEPSRGPVYFEIGLYTTGDEPETAEVTYEVKDSPGYVIESNSQREIEVPGASSENEPHWKRNWLRIRYDGDRRPPPPAIQLVGRVRTKGADAIQSSSGLFFLVWPTEGEE